MQRYARLPAANTPNRTGDNPGISEVEEEPQTSRPQRAAKDQEENKTVSLEEARPQIQSSVVASKNASRRTISHCAN